MGINSTNPVNQLSERFCTVSKLSVRTGRSLAGATPKIGWSLRRLLGPDE